MQNEYNLEELRNVTFARCKSLWGAGFCVKFLVFTFGTIVVLVPLHEKFVAIMGLLFAGIAELLQWLSDRCKSEAQKLHRKLDLQNSFGWQITPRERKDFFARYLGDIEQFAIPAKGNFFASEEKHGPRRAVENLHESSWWSMHLSQTMFWMFVAIIVAIIAFCIVLLNISVHDVSKTTSTLTAQEAGSSGSSVAVVNASVVRVVTAAMLCIFSYGFLKFATGYFSFKEKASEIVDKTENLLVNGGIDEIQAIKLWQEYHLGRDRAPLIPTWIWRLREKKLNKLWSENLVQPELRM